MALLSTTTIEKRREQVRKAQERQYAKHKANLADPAWRKEQNEKRQAATQRQLAKRIQKQREEKAAPKEDVNDIKIADISKRKPVKSRKATSKGMKGRTPTAEEKRIMNLIGQLPCECCARMGRYSPVISLHHTDGRVKPNAHAKSLPLCQWHHDTPVSPDMLTKYPDLIPFHAKGKEGGKAAWEKVFGSQHDVLVDVWKKIGLSSAEIELFELPNQ